MPTVTLYVEPEPLRLVIVGMTLLAPLTNVAVKSVVVTFVTSSPNTTVKFTLVAVSAGVPDKVILVIFDEVSRVVRLNLTTLPSLCKLATLSSPTT